MKSIVLLLIFVLFAPMAAALDANEMFADPQQEARARDIGRQLRCVKCRNQSIFDSNAGIAKDLRVLVRERMVAGDSDEQILEYVQSRFGDYVLLKPPVAGHTYVLWLAPVTFLLIGGVALVVFLSGKQRQQPSVLLSDEDRTEAQALLGQEKY